MMNIDLVLELEPKDRRAPLDLDGLAATAVPVVVCVSSPTLSFGLEALVRNSSGITFGESTRSFDELVKLCRNESDCVALVDTDKLPGGAGDAMRQLRTATSDARVVFISDAQQPHVVRDAFKNGASGFVCKTAETPEIRTSLLAAARRQRYIAAGIAGNLAESLTFEDLTAREMDVLQLLSRGECNKIIARHLSVSVGTVKVHVRAILGKLDSRSRTAAVLKAHRIGLVHIR